MIIDRSSHRAATRPAAASSLQAPPVLVRTFVAVLGVAMLAFTSALMLSDRAPGLIHRLFGDFGRRLSARIDSGGQARQALNDGNVGGDSLVHVALWSMAVVFFALAIWTWRGLTVSAIAVLAFSMVVEVGQGALSTTRSIELRDAVFNVVGVVFGVFVTSGIFWLRASLDSDSESPSSAEQC